jgi:uncharacterized protein
LAVSTFPPLRQFGLMSSAAFLLALIADFTALPAALWITSRQRPQSEKSAGPETPSVEPRPRGEGGDDGGP